ncbi:MAG: DUF1491 family protein [Parasphingorhabdus sp.]|nr:DUF1491 family protein [Parasphingorhabdus sp.]
MGGPRVTSKLLVGAMLRQVQASGGFGTVVRHGDDIAGIILIVATERSRNPRIFEQIRNMAGALEWARIGTEMKEAPPAVDEYLERRVKSDPDIWIIELDIADEEQLNAIMSLSN